MIREKSSVRVLGFFIVTVLFIGLAPSSSTAFDFGSLKKMFTPTTVDRVEYKVKCKKKWKGKTVFIDFDTSRSYWRYEYVSSLAQDIKDKLIEDVVEDGCFNVQDRRTGKRYAYKISVTISNPRIQVSKNTINKLSATFRVKTYDRHDNLITAKKRKVKYERPSFVVTSGDSQEQLVEDYAYNVSQQIRESVYKSLK